MLNKAITLLPCIGIGEFLPVGAKEISVPKLDQLVEEAVKRGHALVDECAKNKDSYTVEGIASDLFIRTSASVVPKDGGLHWAIEMMEEIPEIYTYPLDKMGPMSNIQEIVAAVVEDLVLEASAEDVEDYARKFGFASDEYEEGAEAHLFAG